MKASTRQTRISAISTIVEPTSTSFRRRKLRPLETSKTTLSARRAASSTPVVPYSASPTLITSVVVAVPLAWKALRSELSSGSTSEPGRRRVR